MIFSGSMMGLASVGQRGPTSFTTWNPADKSADITLSNGNLTMTETATNDGARAVAEKTSGKHYFEVTNGNPPANRSADDGLGLAVIGQSLGSNFGGGSEESWAFFTAGDKSFNNLITACADDWQQTGDVAMCAFNADTGECWFGTNGVWGGSGNPATGANPAFTGITGTIYPLGWLYSNTETFTANFGQNAWAYTPPSGFFGWGING